MKLSKIEYSSLNARQKENYNYQKVSAVLADYGFATIRLTDDWNAADFLAMHIDGSTLKIQLKGRLTLGKKYIGKDLWICFPNGNAWYLYPHDEILNLILASSSVGESESWVIQGNYSFNGLGRKLTMQLEKYLITGD